MNLQRRTIRGWMMALMWGCFSLHQQLRMQNLAMLSEVMGVSKKQLYRKIKQCSDQMAVEYIRKLRLQKAASLLRNPRFTINEVMYMVGFSNPSYFSRSFTSEFGMTPTEYRSRK